MTKIKQFMTNIQLIRKEESKLNRYILNVALSISFIFPALFVWVIHWLTWDANHTNGEKGLSIAGYIVLYIGLCGYSLWKTYRNTEVLRKNIERQKQQPVKKSYLSQKQKDDMKKQRQLQKLKQQNRRRKKK